jgi:predicted transcriptional regulator
MYNIKSVLKECNLDSVVCDEDFTDITTFTGEKKKYNPISSFVVGNVNLTTHTFTIIGYLKDDKYKKAKTPLALTYPAPKSKACKTTQLQKDLKKLTMNYEVVE